MITNVLKVEQKAKKKNIFLLLRESLVNINQHRVPPYIRVCRVPLYNGKGPSSDPDVKRNTVGSDVKEDSKVRENAADSGVMGNSDVRGSLVTKAPPHKSP